MSTDLERLITFMQNLSDAGMERPYMVKRGYDFAVLRRQTCYELDVRAGDVLSTALQFQAMEDAAKLLKDAVKVVT